MEINLCQGKGCCPKVTATKNGVQIGEKGNLVKLKAKEWNFLVDSVRNGKIDKI